MSLRAVDTAPPEVARPHDGRNEGIPFDQGWVDNVHVNLSAVERRTSTIGTRSEEHTSELQSH